ncbi:N-acyl-aromatic-L-amino acid amidohydrolase (carboxylate-forming) isoform X2 [Perognathus longimembris pacificus]|uniref:N-acyl-aromatic-L-amino acid amidohydrolase (carboxylate-forming) isoform X2 n=1 Tax=Perognathus longimembris pacificus TaxID=214514 RepID=UPI002019F71E|nr:N-acyl-aromatic-L-amino acid amidohydrolase (carboxylate-forming) isoform X2 [Perognathus longimembris pacificus]
MPWLPTPREPLLRVAVTGGTHGNEMSGVYLARHWLQCPEELRRPSFSAIPILANPEASAACSRYVGQDLNRSFTSAVLTSRATSNDPYEVTRARELNQWLGPKASGQAFDFILDLHNTTANMRACILANSDCCAFAMHMCHYLQSGETFSLQSVAKMGLSLELGPQPQGVLQADIFSQMRALVASSLDFIELFNQGTGFPAFEMEVYRHCGEEDFPRTEAGDLAGIVHPQLQDQDFEPLQPGAPIFQLFSGEEVLYQGDRTVYPMFINEAAYYEKHMAFMKTEKTSILVPALPPLPAAAPIQTP